EVSSPIRFNGCGWLLGAVIACTITYAGGVVEIRHIQMGLVAEAFNFLMNTAAKELSRTGIFFVAAVLLLLRSGAWSGYAWILNDYFPWVISLEIRMGSGLSPVLSQKERLFDTFEKHRAVQV
ncbi:hypothetical protein AKJ16_DCAP22740, partial [Drosera capensis]